MPKKGKSFVGYTLFDATNNFVLNETAYAQKAPVYLGTSFALNYLSNFLAVSSLISTVILYHGKTIWRQFKAAMSQVTDDEEDIHNRLMKSYRDIPEWLVFANSGSFWCFWLFVQFSLQ